MIPLSYFLIVWTILLAIFGILMLLTLIQMLQHGLPTSATYLSTFLFLIVTASVVLGTAFYLSKVDWSTQVSIIPWNIPGFTAPPQSIEL